jgi:thiol-disulfide isomerase/thioredoxin
MKTVTFTFTIFVLSVLIIFSCQTDSKQIIIRGDLKSLSDGTAHLININPWKIIDSATVKDGKFTFLLAKEKYPEPTAVKIICYNHKKEPNILLYPTNQKLGGKPLAMDIFLLENGIEISGEVESFEWSSKLKNPIKTGQQTQVMYNDSIGFSKITKIYKIKEAINKHPYSFYYLFELGKRVQGFTNDQFLELFDCFDKEVQNSQTGKDLKDYVLKRKNKKLNETSTALDTSGKPQKIINPVASLNMIILWASWCGPCRMEIPNLKLLYQKYHTDDDFNMVSISVDQDSLDWVKALEKEKMPWKQLLLKGENEKYKKELFSFDGAIPLILFVDNRGKIIKKVNGYSEEHNKELFMIVENLTKYK